ncbi:MAG TPA: glycosyltransferase [Puia sp.]|uniref:glycosyltransferase n=1 Tax=Puia sp. TaxID=2045100 RepID=UPI002CB56B8E|nr:glycosyltransferase [Puia sp.]HVU99210.1 glycosyltransferase [Puia sp.]
MDRQNVLFFIFRLHGGGAERVVSNLSMDLEQDYTIRIAVFDKIDKVYPHKGELIRINVPFSGDPATNNKAVRAIRLWLLVRRLRKIKRIHKIDTTVSFGEQANIINVLSGGRTVLSVRTLLSTEMRTAPNMRVLRNFVKTLYTRGDHIIVPSRVAGQDLSGNFSVPPEKIKVIYNYLDPQRIDRFAVESLDDQFLKQLFGLPVLLNVGRITAAKGQWLLLEMMPAIKERYPDFRLVIIGEAEKGAMLKDELLARAAELGLKVYDQAASHPRSLDNDIFLLGFQPNPYKFMRHSQVLLFPSVFEGFPNTLLEAMQSGLPVISADCQSGPREIMAPDSDLAKSTPKAEYTPYGVLCPTLPTAEMRDGIDPGIIREWLTALFTVLDDAALRQSLIENGYRRVKDFDRETILRSWRESLSLP